MPAIPHLRFFLTLPAFYPVYFTVLTCSDTTPDSVVCVYLLRLPAILLADYAPVPGLLLVCSAFKPYYPICVTLPYYTHCSFTTFLLFPTGGKEEGTGQTEETAGRAAGQNSGRWGVGTEREKTR